MRRRRKERITGGMRTEKIATKRYIPSGVIANYVRKKISFSLLKSLVNCLRGTRTRNGKNPININDVEITETVTRILES